MEFCHLELELSGCNKEAAMAALYRSDHYTHVYTGLTVQQWLLHACDIVRRKGCMLALIVIVLSSD